MCCRVVGEGGSLCVTCVCPRAIHVKGPCVERVEYAAIHEGAGAHISEKLSHGACGPPVLVMEIRLFVCIESIRVHLTEDSHGPSHSFAARQAVRPDFRSNAEDPGRTVEVGAPPEVRGAQSSRLGPVRRRERACEMGCRRLQCGAEPPICLRTRREECLANSLQVGGERGCINGRVRAD